jgi:hypothetical protein
MSNTKDDNVRRDVLNRLVLKPRMKQAARDAGIHPTTLFGWIKQSVAGDPKMVLTWLGHEAPFHQHVNAARKLNIVALDHAARDLAINGHSEPRYHDGKPPKADIRLQRNVGRFGPETDIASVCGRTAKYVTDPGIKAWYCS